MVEPGDGNVFRLRPLDNSPGGSPGGRVPPAPVRTQTIAREEMDREDSRIIGPEWISRDFLSEYWRNLSYDLSAEIAGLDRFFRLAAKIGRIRVAPPLRFLDLD